MAGALLASAPGVGQGADDIGERVPRRDSAPSSSAAAPPELAPDRQAPAAGPQQTFVLAAVVFADGTVFQPSELAPAYEDYLTKPVSAQDVALIAEAVTRLYRDAGYVLSRAVVPPQGGEGGVLRLVLVEGYITEVEVTGPAPEAVAERLEPVTLERPLRMATLDRAIALAGDLSGVTLSNSRLVPDTEDLAAYRLVVETAEDRFDAWAYADNRGVGASGEAQVYLSSALNGLLRTGDRVSAGVFTAPEHPDALLFAELGYDLPVGAAGTTLSVYGSYSGADAGSSLATPSVDTESRRVLVRIAHPLIRGRSFTLRGDAGLEQRSLQERRGGAMSFEDELRIVDIGVNALRTRSGAATTLDLRLRAGLEAFGASTGGTGPLSRPDADGEFTQLRLFASRYQDVGDSFGIYAALRGQVSSDPVLATEEFRFGGAEFGRGFDYAWLAGDDGVDASAELRYGRDPNLPSLDFYQLYGFYDAGWVWSQSAAAVARYGQASSAGVGLRLTVRGDTQLTVEAAKPQSGSGAADDDWRGFVSLSSSF